MKLTEMLVVGLRNSINQSILIVGTSGMYHTANESCKCAQRCTCALTFRHTNTFQTGDPGRFDISLSSLRVPFSMYNKNYLKHYHISDGVILAMLSTA